MLDPGLIKTFTEMFVQSGAVVSTRALENSRPEGCFISIKPTAANCCCMQIVCRKSTSTPVSEFWSKSDVALVFWSLNSLIYFNSNANIGYKVHNMEFKAFATILVSDVQRRSFNRSIILSTLENSEGLQNLKLMLQWTEFRFYKGLILSKILCPQFSQVFRPWILIKTFDPHHKKMRGKS